MDLSQVTLSQMRYAVAVGEARSFKQASEACRVSQSGLSMQVQKLEALLGVVLFDRGKKPVMVTAAGAKVLGQMRAVLRETERLGQVVAEGEEPAGRYRLGVIPSLSPTVLPLVLGPFVARYPQVELVVEELKTDQIIARLREDTLDAGLAATPLDVDGLSERPLALEPMVAYLPVGDPLLAKPVLEQAELAARDLWVMPEGHCFRTQVLALCRSDRRPHPGSVQFESGSFQTLVRLVDQGLGATVLPELVVRELPPHRRDAQVRRLVDPAPAREIGLVTAREHLRRRVTDALAEVAAGVLRETLSRPAVAPTVLHPLQKP